MAPTTPPELFFRYHFEARFPKKKSNDFESNFANCQQKSVPRATLLTMAPTTPPKLYFRYHFEARFPKKKIATISEATLESANIILFIARRCTRWCQRRRLNVILGATLKHVSRKKNRDIFGSNVVQMAFAARPLRINSRVHRGLRGDLWNRRGRLKQQRFDEQESRRQK